MATRLARALLACLLGALYAVVGPAPPTWAYFTGTDAVTGNAFAAAASFPDYPSTIVADGPLFYHRLDDAAGTLTAADSSGNGRTGVYGIGVAATWTGLWPMD